MRVIERFRALEDDLDDFLDRQQRICLGIRFKRLTALNVLHYDVTRFLVDSSVVYTDDVGVRQAAGSMRFVKEHLAVAVARFHVIELLGMRDLDRDLPVDIGIVTEVNRPHTAAINLFDDFVFA